MSTTPSLQSLSQAELAGLEIASAGPVDLRRDLYQFVCYVRDKGLTRTRRGNEIPKTAARRLAKLLSLPGEAAYVEEYGCGHWSHAISRLARHMGLVSYDVEGIYAGYSSSEPCFPDNIVQLQAEAWERYLALSGGDKEREILACYRDHTPSEFFYAPLLLEAERFSIRGSATGPASRMDLSHIRQTLLDILGRLQPDVWYEVPSLVRWLQAQHPTLILDPKTREPTRESGRARDQWIRERRLRGRKCKAPGPEPPLQFQDLYVNFREYDRVDGKLDWEHWRQLSSTDAHGFERVEGRYVEAFLMEIPYLCGLVELAFRGPEDPYGTQVSPPLGRMRGFRLTQRGLRVLNQDPALSRVKLTVLPTFELLVEAPSYPESTLEQLAPYTLLLSEDGPIHRLRVERKKVVEHAARAPDAPAAGDLLCRLSAPAPLPANVAAELAAWTRRGDAVVVYEGFGLLELLASAEDKAKLLSELGARVADPGPERFVLLRDPEAVFASLEQAGRVPARVAHRSKGFTKCPGKLGAGPAKTPRKKRTPSTPRARKALLESEDLVGYRSDDTALLAELHRELKAHATTCERVGPGLLVLSAAALPRLRKTLTKLADRFEVTLRALASDATPP